MKDEDRCVAAVKARLEAYGFGPHHPGVNRDELARRRRIALGVIVTVALTMTLANIGSGQPMRVVLLRVAYIALELPLLFFFVARAYDRALVRRYGPLPTLVVSGATAMSVGVVASSFYWLLGKFEPAIFDCVPPEMRNRFVPIVAMGAAVGLAHLGVFALAVVYPFAAQDARVRALEAERLRTTAELARLRGHLEPHFLLNTLNAIAGLVTEDPREARRLLAALGDLLRDALRDGDEMQSMEQEEAWLRRYAEILESRHKGSLAFRWEIDPAVRHTPIPRLLLQPLVENAVKHGALRRRGGGTVTVRAGRADVDPDVVVCTVEDDGPGFAEGPIRQGAVGLNVVRRRLELKFPSAEMRIESSTDGTRAIVAFHAARSGADTREPVPARVPKERQATA